MNCKLDFRNQNKADAENRLKMFLMVMDKDIYRKRSEMKGFENCDFPTTINLCENYFKGVSINLPEETIIYLDKKRKESDMIYRYYLQMVKDFGLTEVKIW